MTAVEVRAGAGTDAELDALAPLWASMVEHHREMAAGALPVRSAEAAWALRRAEYRRWVDDGTGLLLLGFVDGAAVPEGYAFLRLVGSGPTFDYGERRGEVESLAVAPSRRGSGLGTALLEAGRRELLARGCTWWTVTVMEDNPGAVALYRRAGFRPWLLELAGPLADDGSGGG